MKKFLALFLSVVAIVGVALASEVTLYPSYSTSDTTQWKWGLECTGTGSTDGSQAPSEKYNWYRAQATLLHGLQPGTYTVKEFDAAVKNWVVGDAKSLYAGIYHDTNPSANNVGTMVALWSTELSPSATNDWQVADSSPDESFTITSSHGPIYAIVTVTKNGWNTGSSSMSIRTAHANSKPGIGYGYKWSADPVGDGESAFPPELTDHTTIDKTNDGKSSPIVLSQFGTGFEKLVLETANKTIISYGEAGDDAYSGGTDNFLVPLNTSSDYWIFLRDVNVPDDETLTITLGTYYPEDPDGGGALYGTDLRSDGTFAMEFTTNTITFGDYGSETVLDLAASGEEGDDFDIGLNVRPGTGKIDCFYCNLTTPQGPLGSNYDLRTSSVYVTTNGIHFDGGADPGYTITAPKELRCVNAGEGASIESIIVAHKPLVILGDSQANGGTDLGVQLPTAFTYDRPAWNAAIGYGRPEANYTNSVDSTAGYLRFRHTTPGLGDLCDMTGVIHVWPCFGVNSLGPTIITDDQTQNEVVGEIAFRAQEFAHYAIDNNNEVLFIGLPYCTSASYAGPITQMNRALRGIAASVRGTYYDPYDLVYAQQGTYLSDAIHLSETGATAVAAKAIQEYEAGQWIWHDDPSVPGGSGTHYRGPN
jgi:hypothetical protein